MCVHRSCLKDDLLEIFKTESYTSTNLSFKVIDEKGRVEEGEGIGVARDVISTFWQQLFSSATVGDVEKVPAIRHDYQQSQWRAMGHILVYGFEKLSFFPLGLSRAFIASCLFGEDQIDTEYLLSSFRCYITADEREVYDKVLVGDVTDNDDDLLDFLGNYKCFKSANKGNIKAIISELAHQELIQRPRYIAQCWAEPLSVLKTKAPFKSPQDISAFYEEKRPTAKKVIKAILANPANEAERQSLDFLKKFIRSLDVKSLESFLKFTTGSCMMLQHGISISFTTMEGLARRPIAHTCGPLIELPCTYQTYNELAEELTNILREKGAWGFNIV